MAQTKQVHTRKERKADNKASAPAQDTRGTPGGLGQHIGFIYKACLSTLGPVPSPSPGSPCPCHPGLLSVWSTGAILSWLRVLAHALLHVFPLARTHLLAHTPPKV